MKVKILVDTVANKKIVKSGDVVDVTDSDARLLIGIKKAVKFEAVQAEAPAEEVKQPNDEPEAVEQSEQAPKKKGKKS